MKNFAAFMERHFLPIASKIGSLKYLVVIRDAFIAIMPITMVGSFAVLLNVFFRDIPNANNMTGFVESMTPLISINGNVWFGSLAIISLVFVFALGYNIAVANKVNPIAGGLVTFASFIAVMPQMANFNLALEKVTPENLKVIQDAGIAAVQNADKIELPASGWGFIGVNYTGSGGLFTALIVGLITGIIYSALMKKKIGIKLPESVPPAVNSAFASIVPGVVAVYVAAIIAYVVTNFTGESLHDLILKYVQLPLLGLSQGIVAVIIATIMIQVFWFFGIHGHNVLAPVLDGVYLPALLENSKVYEATHNASQLPYLWTRGSFDAYAQMGGSGVTIALIIAIFLFSKREDSRAIAKLAAPMGIFNINEPITYGMPIVLNPIYIIPWIIVPPICAVIAYGFTAAGIIPPVFLQIPWITPPGIYAYLATGGNIMAALVSLLNVAIAFVIWTPFVFLANSYKEENIEM